MGFLSRINKRRLFLAALVIVATIYAKGIVKSIDAKLPNRIRANPKIVKAEKKLIREAERGDLDGLKGSARKTVQEIEQVCSINKCEVNISDIPPFADELMKLQNSLGDLYGGKMSIDDFTKNAEDFRARYGQYREAVREVNDLVKAAKDMARL